MSALFRKVGGMSRGDRLVNDFLTQMDAYYASPASGFYDNAISRRYYEQKLRHLKFTPYPNDGLVTFGASGTNLCDRQLVFKNDKATRPEKSDDIPFRGRQRRLGTAVVDYIQLDIVHMPKRLGKGALFTMAERKNTDMFGNVTFEWDFEEAAQERKVFEYPHPETGELVQFAITAKPDGKFDYAPDGSRIIFEYKTKASGLRAMNGKLDYKGAQDDHVRQVTAEAIIFGINEALIVYESTQKPAWFSDEERTSVTKGQKTWADGQPRPDLRAFYVEITDDMKNALLSDLARQAALVYEQRAGGAVPDVTIEMTDSCGFCAFSGHCKATLTAENKTVLKRQESAMAASSMAGKAEHRNLTTYLEGVSA
ncbi:hypothetical protein [Paenibacillus sp. P22]|uniref:hypothetical protein n=1 Tax=Paenibacillus sp. P22 TaxID=483908 RepID=UPI00038F33CC|nr:hypothetical protein [Paenibacillus sp. P22]CDN42041.1 Uncharacterized protein BN871_AT_00430 [Paenibacillus sp. P22]